jgi:hypothetical protein
LQVASHRSQVARRRSKVIRKNLDLIHTFA